MQPWRYLFEVACQLSDLGHAVSIITNGASPAFVPPAENVTIHHLPTVSNPWWKPNRALQQTIQQLKPDVIFWHVGLTSFLHQRLRHAGAAPIVGIFTSPIYHLRELAPLGVERVVSGFHLTLVHILGTLAPKWLLRRLATNNHQLQRLVVQTETTRQMLLSTGVWLKNIDVIKPGVDEVWSQFQTNRGNDLRVRLGYHPGDKVVLYFGSPAPLRGLHTLIKAVQQAATAVPDLKLIILSRRHTSELIQEDAQLRQLLAHSETEGRVQAINGYLEAEELVAHLAVADIVALPFELVPSDAPLSLLEAKTLGKPVVTTTSACLPELVADSPHYLARPADTDSLADALIRAVNDLDCEQSHLFPTRRTWQQVGSEWAHLIQGL
ncbi:MAG TPA: glycosyltransferase family 4 protein [Chloroflexota bacterium]|nr:glycosyltransferase family 4 protein [Chloroflexota bacterium]